jgi:major curlin subunit
MKKSLVFLVCIFFSSISGLKAQNYIQGVQLMEVVSFNSHPAHLNFLSKQEKTTSNPNFPNFSGNNIFISQIGIGNKVKSTTKSQSSNIRISQMGNYNISDLNIKARTIRETVIQKGNNNKFKDYNIGVDRVNLHMGKIVQYGNDHSIEWYGNNSISESLNISQNGNGYGKTILVRSFSQ